MGALVIDVAALYQERRELQSGADAGALAVAKDCATAVGSACPASITTTAQSYADANADDGRSNVDSICGNLPGLAVCTNPPTVPTGARYVRVTTSTVDGANGRTEVSFGLARALGMTGERVHASAVAAWGPIGGATTIPLTFSLCEFNAATNNGTTFASGPPWVGVERYVYFHGTNAATSCPAGPSGGDLPGGFGWLDNVDCEVDIDAGDWVDDDPGNDVPNDCRDHVVEWRDKVLLLPIYSQTNGLNGNNGSYRIAGFAAIHITGYRFPGQRQHEPVAQHVHVPRAARQQRGLHSRALHEVRHKWRHRRRHPIRDVGDPDRRIGPIMKRKLGGSLAALLLATLGTVALVGYVQSAKDRAVAGERMVDVLVVTDTVAKGTTVSALGGLGRDRTGARQGQSRAGGRLTGRAGADVGRSGRPRPR